MGARPPHPPPAPPHQSRRHRPSRQSFLHHLRHRCPRQRRALFHSLENRARHRRSGKSHFHGFRPQQGRHRSRPRRNPEARSAKSHPLHVRIRLAHEFLQPPPTVTLHQNYGRSRHRHQFPRRPDEHAHYDPPSHPRNP